jgi:hypothetical protein
MSTTCRCRADSLGGFLLLGAVYDSLLPLPGIFLDGIKRDHGCSVG